MLIRVQVILFRWNCVRNGETFLNCIFQVTFMQAKWTCSTLFVYAVFSSWPRNLLVPGVQVNAEFLTNTVQGHISRQVTLVGFPICIFSILGVMISKSFSPTPVRTTCSWLRKAIVSRRPFILKCWHLLNETKSPL